MNTLSIIDILNKKISSTVQVMVKGWIRTRRDSKSGISFLNLYDGSCLSSLQIVVSNTLSNYYRDVLHLTAGCAIAVCGYIIPSIGKKQNVEMQAENIEVVGWVKCPDNYPVSSKYHSMEYLREVAHLRSRTHIIGSIMRIRHVSAYAIHNYMNNNGFLWISTPVITSCDTEGISKMFKVSTLNLENLPLTPEGKVNYKKDFFAKEAFLTVSGQLNAESYACALSKVYTFGPIFRAESSNTNRHLAEFWMLEPEIAFADLKDVINLSTSLLKYICKIVLDECVDDLCFLADRIDSTILNRLELCINSDFINISYLDAISILKLFNKEFNNPIIWGMDLSLEHERFLTEKYFKSPVVITDYPKDTKAFYMRLNDDEKTVAAMDLLVPKVGEIIGGSQREERIDILDLRLQECNLNKKDYWWYRDLRCYGTVPHAGFGLGFERLILYITGIQNIKDVIPFPRYPYNINF